MRQEGILLRLEEKRPLLEASPYCMVAGQPLQVLMVDALSEGIGTVEDPASLASALEVASPYDIIVVRGDRGEIPLSGISLKPHQMLLGFDEDGRLDIPLGGQTFSLTGPSERPLLKGSNGEGLIQLAAYNRIAGIDIQGSPKGIIGWDVLGCRIEDVTIADCRDVGIELESVEDILIEKVRF